MKKPFNRLACLAGLTILLLPCCAAKKSDSPQAAPSTASTGASALVAAHCDDPSHGAGGWTGPQYDSATVPNAQDIAQWDVKQHNKYNPGHTASLQTK